ncbi:MAG: biopolymer transporter ExbB [Legionellales bacterium]|nr:biopolymer transporter ExbB [Legionellales bacterium]
MWPIMLCSVIAMAIIGERLLSLRQKKIAPKNLVALVWQWQNAGHLDKKRINNLRKSSPLGTILAAGLVNRNHSREIMKESIEETGRHIAHDMEHFLSTLGTIASISPLLGLLGTVIGMIKVFTVITSLGVGDPSVLSEGISEALITTAAGLTVAIPSLMFHRFFRGKIDGLIITMEQEALKMVEVMDGIRENEIEAGA